ncbi:MAG: hypothetical protein M1816_006960 [Peltula sp. TS41687]|nr:MAG: hypothetical protein M1816_006960 [Peltula sp. TS41687]
MKVLSVVCVVACLLARPVLGVSGLIGYGIYPYEPPCAHACQRVLSSLKLQCSHDMEVMGMMHGPSGMTSPQCRAGDTPYLTTLAWCMQTECAKFNLPPSKLQIFWEQYSTEDPTVAPKWDYRTTLFEIHEPPTQELTKGADTLNFTTLVNPKVYESQYNALTAVYRENVVEAGFGIAILVAAVGVPLALSCLGYVPYMSGVLDKIRPYLVYPSTIRTYQARPLPYLLGNVPTIGQSLYILAFFLLNLILTAVNYQYKQPHAWYPNLSKEVTAYIFYRTGFFAFVLLPLLLLFSSRNNLLLWMTNWSHSTFILLHRWIARICALQALLHTLLALPLYYPAEAKQQYWIWGAVATVALMVLVFASGFYVRSFAYEFFLISHILLSVFVLVGCWYHIYDWIKLTWGYETWLYAACAVWFFDRLVRVARILKNGLRRAKVTDLGGGYIRVDVNGIRWGLEPGNHVYACFPTLMPLRPWENHPFSVVPTAFLRPSRHSSISSDNGGQVAAESDDVDVEKHKLARRVVEPTAQDGPTTTASITLLIKKSTGMTKYLQAHDSLLTLLDGPYPNNSIKAVLRSDRLLLIGGGIGITGVLPWAAHHPNVKLCWSVKETAKCLVEELDGALSKIPEKDVRVGGRLNISELLADEVNSGWARVGVVVAGPGWLCDDVRAAVVTAGKNGKTVFELGVDAYAW